MNISQISFGRKSPRYICQIQDKETGKYTPATCYEYDCKDESDYEEIKKINRRWIFKDNIAKNMEISHNRQTYFNEESNESFFVLQKGKELLGLVQVCSENGTSNIDYITTMPNNPYKYVGQTLIACVGKQVLNKNNYEMTVNTPIDTAVPFYQKIGFKKYGKYPLDVYKMNTDEIKTFIDVTELTTEAPIIDVKA